MPDVYALYKLIVLYVLQRSEQALTNGQICDLIIEKGYTDYFTLQQNLSEMVTMELLTSEKVRNSTFYSPTPKGLEMLEYFEQDISIQIRDEISSYLKENGVRLREENSVLADYTMLENGECRVHLCISENKEMLLDLFLNVPTERDAVFACDNWKKQYISVYQSLIGALLADRQ